MFEYQRGPSLRRAVAELNLFARPRADTESYEKRAREDGALAGRALSAYVVRLHALALSEEARRREALLLVSSLYRACPRDVESRAQMLSHRAWLSLFLRLLEAYVRERSSTPRLTYRFATLMPSTSTLEELTITALHRVERAVAEHEVSPESGASLLREFSSTLSSYVVDDLRRSQPKNGTEHVTLLKECVVVWREFSPRLLTLTPHRRAR